MNTIKHKLLTATLCFSAVLMSATYTSADDTEIFFGSATSGDDVIYPNLLFVMDTSSSMTQTDGTGIPRIDRMKTALTSMIESANNVNIGIMRFNGNGSAVLYPVRYIDEVTESLTEASLSSRIATGTDDAEQDASGGTMTLTNSQLRMTTVSSASSGTIDVRVSQNSDDMEERVSNGSIQTTSGDLEFMKESTNLQIVGVRFPNLAIPNGSTINSASLEFTIEELVSGKSNKSVEIKIFAEADDTGTFTNTAYNISNRVKTSLSTTWNITATSPAVNATIATSDIKAVVQEVVSKTSWNGANDALTFIMNYVSGDGVRTVYRHRNTPAKAARLQISYTPPGDTGGTISHLVGLRFQNLAIPQGAAITSAKIDFTTAVPSSGSASYTIVGQDTDSADTFSTTNNDLSTRSSVGNRTSNSVTWNADNWTAINDVNSTPDLKSIVQEITDRAGWCGGNGMVFIISENGEGSSRFAKAFEESAGASPQLTVTYDASEVPEDGGCIAKTYSSMVSGNSNDAEQKSGVVSLNDVDLEMVADGSGPSNVQTIGMRFQSLNIPKESEVTEAYLEFTAKDALSGSTTLIINGQNTDSAATFTATENDISSRPKTGASVSWSSVPSWSSGVKYRSPDIKSVVQPIVSRSGWAPGNDMAFIITGSGVRRAESYEGNAAAAPRLVVRAKSKGPESASRTVRDELLSVVEDMHTSGGTPIVDSLYEAALYYRGEAVGYGKTRGTNSASYKRYDRVSHEDTYANGTHEFPTGCSATDLNDIDCVGEAITGSPVYESPIDHECQLSSIVLLSDGEASQNNSVEKVQSMAGISSCSGTNDDEKCGVELSSFLSSTDQSDLIDDQKIKTYTIGFNISTTFLENLATDDDGYYTANSASELLGVFDEILPDMLKVDTTFVSPGVTVNSFNRLNHRDELYFSLFSPSTKPNWEGNLKRFRLDKSGKIYDKDDKEAVDASTGFFNKGIKSWWLPDGEIEDKGEGEEKKHDLAKGGAATKLPAPESRKIFTYYSGASVDLSSNEFSTENSNITKARLNISAESDSYRANLINWTLGVDLNDDDGDGNFTESRKALADPLHSVPHLVTYGGTDEAPDITIYYGDNQGFVHAIDGDTGIEDFAFIPEELLPNLNTFFSNSGDHPYGMDGAVTSWVNDKDKDNQIESADGDHVYLYAGMRRGGRSYYALDVTNRAAPEFLWKITGGSGTFAELGQTWSRPTRTKVKINNAVTDVLIFTGGYDEAQDDYTVRTADSMGRALYIVNAKTGALVWSGGGPSSSGTFDETYADMLYSIPSSVRIIDVNGDHFVDQIYVGDMGGQLWRFDVTNGNNLTTLIDGGVIADIAGSTAESNRRFYHAPDVSVQNLHAQKTLLIAMGSGYQAHPLNTTIEDRFYVFKDANVFSKPVDSSNNAVYTKLTESDLFDTTDNLIGEGTDEQQATASTAMNAAKGWYIRLTREGEKVLASSTTVAGEIFFTTFEPTPTTVNCEVSAGKPRLFRVHAKDGTPVVNYDKIVKDDDVELTKNDREITLYTKALPPEPQRLRVDGQDILCIGTECETITGVDTVIRTYWVEDQQ